MPVAVVKVVIKGTLAVGVEGKRALVASSISFSHHANCAVFSSGILAQAVHSLSIKEPVIQRRENILISMVVDFEH